MRIDASLAVSHRGSLAISRAGHGQLVETRSRGRLKWSIQRSTRSFGKVFKSSATPASVTRELRTFTNCILG